LVEWYALAVKNAVAIMFNQLERMKEMNNSTVTVEIRFVYGNSLIYPINDNACKFAQLIGKKTLSMKDIEAIKSLGFNVEYTGVN